MQIYIRRWLKENIQIAIYLDKPAGQLQRYCPLANVQQFISYARQYLRSLLLQKFYILFLWED